MENVAEALKIAFAVMMFIIALTLSISSFSQATSAVNAITTARDRESNYTYVVPTEDLTRTVGIETVVSTMYRAYEENIEIYFFEEDGSPISLYKVTGTDGTLIDVSCIDLANSADRGYKEVFASKEAAREHLDIILGGSKVLNEKSQEVKDKYENKLYYNEGLYKEFKEAEFTEEFGEYLQGSENANSLTKRVVTYTRIN